MLIYTGKQIWIACIALLGHTIAGIATGWSAPMIPKILDPEQSPLPDLPTDVQASWVGSIIYIGAIAGPYISGYLSNLKGRKVCLFLGGSASTISFIILLFTKNLPLLIIARIIMGVGTGTLFIMDLVYIGEIASTNIRGMLLTLTAATNTLGTLLMYCIGPYLSFNGTCGVCLAMCAIFTSATLLLPESPVYLGMKGEEGKAKDLLISLGRSGEIEKVLLACQDIATTSKIEEWVELFTIKSNRRALFITFILSTLQQLSGVLVVVLFATTIFELAGSSTPPHISTIIIGFTLFVSSIITPGFVERLGRKLLLLISSAFCSLSLATLGLYFYLDRIGHASIPNIGWLPLLSLIVCFLAFNLGIGSIPGTLIGEMFRANVRSTGSTLTMTVSWTIGFGVSAAFSYMVAALGPDFTFWMYSGFTAVTFLFTIFFVPETKGKSLLEIQEMLSK